MKPFKAAWRALPFTGDEKPFVTVIELTGVIGVVSGPGQKGLSLSRVKDAIEEAFKPPNLTAVALAINSPGGSPVQSRLIHNAIRKEAAKKKVPVLAFVEDVGASGGYILSIAGDEIYADESSIVGSIGVISAGFGFQELIARYGIERRVYTAGESKSQLDAFKMEKAEDVQRLEGILDDLHAQFIALVKNRRDGKISDSDHGDTFSGAFWTAENAKSRGLIDGIAQMGDFLPARFGDDVKVKIISPGKSSLLQRLLGGEGRLRGASSVAPGEANPVSGLVDPDAIIGAIEERALWSRFGL